MKEYIPEVVGERFRQQLEFLIEVDKMKNVLRQTLLTDKSRRENDAEHSWHFALTAMILKEYCYSDEVDFNHVIQMALVHDLVEVYAGDTFAYDAKGYEDKMQRESEAADKLFGILPADQGSEIRALWEEFDAMETPDSIYANAIDVIQPFINNYVTQGHTWQIGYVDSGMVRKRLSRVERGMPRLWEFVEYVIDDSVKKGYLKP